MAVGDAIAMTNETFLFGAESIMWYTPSTKQSLTGRIITGPHHETAGLKEPG